MTELATYLDQSAALHKHLCPRQVLGARIGMYAAELLGLELPQTNKRLLAFVETDGCFAAYQAIPTTELLCAEEVTLAISLAALISRPGVRVNCDQCGEVIINEREVRLGSQTLCRNCAGEHYYYRAGQADYIVDDSRSLASPFVLVR